MNWYNVGKHQILLVNIIIESSRNCDCLNGVSKHLRDVIIIRSNRKLVLVEGGSKKEYVMDSRTLEF